MSHVTHQLAAQKREVLGSKVNSLRVQGMVPGNIYGKGISSIAIQIKAKDLEKTLQEVGESALVNISLEGEKDSFPVLFKNPTYDPLLGSLQHIEMYKVNMKEKITTMVPLVLIGEAPAVKQGLLVMEIANEVEVECLPNDLPEKIEVDVAGLEKVDDMVTVGQLKIDTSRIEILTPSETVIVKIEEAQQAEVAEETVVAPSEVEATAQKSPDEAGPESEKSTAKNE